MENTKEEEKAVEQEIERRRNELIQLENKLTKSESEVQEIEKKRNELNQLESNLSKARCWQIMFKIMSFDEGKKGEK